MSMMETYKVLMQNPSDRDMQTAFERSINKQEVIFLIQNLIEERKRSEEYKEKINEVISIASESSGVAGFHLNGEIASWEYLFDWMQ
jgi:hypothetical protein